MKLEKDRARSSVPNPTHVLISVLFDPITKSIHLLGETTGEFFHSLFEPQSGFIEKLMVIGVVVLVFGFGKAKRKRKAMIIQQYLSQPPKIEEV
jgi:hypothetical protein